MQHIATLLGATCCVRLTTLLRHVGYLKSNYYACPGAALLHEPGQTTTTSCNIQKCCMKNRTIFKFEPTTPNTSQDLASRRNRVAKRGLCVTPDNVAIVWPGLLSPIIRATVFFYSSCNTVAKQVETHCCAYYEVCNQLVS